MGTFNMDMQVNDQYQSMNDRGTPIARKNASALT